MHNPASELKQAKDAILNTLIYSDLFAFPLTENEIWVNLKNQSRISKKYFRLALKDISPEVMKINEYYCLSKRSSIIKKRVRLNIISNKKLVIAQKTASLLAKIPTVAFIGLSGSLANNNAKKSDDIDFFIITKINSLWVTRLLCLILLEIIGARRKSKSNMWKDKICLNMFLDEGNLVLSKNRHDLYTAHEIAQLKPLINKNRTHLKFLKVNKWINTYMPNVINSLSHKYNNKVYITEAVTWELFVESLLIKVLTSRFSTWIARTIQLYKINKSITSETVTDTLLAFHPYDYKKRVMNKYKNKLKDKKINSKLVFANRLWYYFNMRNIKKILLFVFVFWILAFPKLSYAQITPSPAILPTCMPTQLDPSGCVPTNVEGFVAEYYKYGLGIIGGFAVLMIIFGSYQILVSRGNPKTLNDGKTIIMYAISGLLLAIFGFVFIEIIAKDILKIPGFG